jgi:hypothetical protein
MPTPSTIEIYFAEQTAPIVCHSVTEVDIALDRLDAETRARLQQPDSGHPLAITVVIPGFQVYMGLGASRSYICIAVEPCDGEYYTAVGDATASGESHMYYGSGQDSYWAPKNLLPPPVVRAALRYFLEHQRRPPELRWQDWDGRDL